MTLKAYATVIQHKSARSQYIFVPARISQDSQYPFKAGDRVEVEIDTENQRLVIVRKGREEKIGK